MPSSWFGFLFCVKYNEKSYEFLSIIIGVIVPIHQSAQIKTAYTLIVTTLLL